jgi:hypothetical protein
VNRTTSPRSEEQKLTADFTDNTDQAATGKWQLANAQSETQNSIAWDGLGSLVLSAFES